MNLHSDSDPAPQYAFPRLALDDGCHCAVCEVCRQAERRVMDAVSDAAGKAGEAKLAAWAAVRVAKRDRDEAERATLRWHRQERANHRE